MKLEERAFDKLKLRITKDSPRRKFLFKFGKIKTKITSFGAN